MPEAKKSNVALWVVGGCLVLIIIGVGSVVGALYWGKKKITNMAHEMADPAMRDKRAKEMLGASALPPGYYAGVNISMGIVETARLTDVSPTGDVQTTYNERGFTYNESIRTDPSDIEDYLAGKRGNVLDKMGTRLRTDEVLRTGTLNVNGQLLQYSARRGEVTQDNEAIPGLFTIFTIACNGDNDERWAVWFEKAAADAKSGTVTDEEAMKAFFGHFNLCR